MSRFQPFSGNLPGVSEFYRHASQESAPVAPEGGDDWTAVLSALGGVLGGLASRALRRRGGAVVVAPEAQQPSAPLARARPSAVAAQPSRPTQAPAAAARVSLKEPVERKRPRPFTVGEPIVCSGGT